MPLPTIEMIDQDAQDEFDSLKAYLQALKNRQRQRGRGLKSSADAKVENRILDDIVLEFDLAAQRYFDTATNIIKQQDEAQARARAYRKVISILTDHMLLIADLARPHLAIEAEPSTKLDRRALVEKSIAIVAHRLNNPKLIALSSQNFQLIHFNYMSNVSVIGIPPQVMMDPSANLCIIWHEVAGYNIAQLRPNKENKYDCFMDWVGEAALADVWSLFQSRYEQSFLADVVAEIEVADNDSGDCGYQIVGCQEIDQFKQETEWRSIWLAEFFEDLFGVQVLQDTMIEALTNALVQRYDHINLGDNGHPPPDIRIQVALEYLRLKDEALADHTERTLVNHYPQLLVSIRPEEKEAAAIIAATYADKVQNQEFSKPDEEISDAEYELAQAVRKARQRRLDGESRETVNKALRVVIDQIDTPAYSTNIDPYSGDFSFSIPKNDFDTILNQARQNNDLDLLLSFEFAMADHVGRSNADCEIKVPPGSERRR
ncbi:MAG: hypothetical protein AAF629_23345 [Chloroflexota bacterium]